MSEMSITVPKTEPLDRELIPLQKSVAAMTVTDKESHGKALELGKRIMALTRFVKEFYAEPKKKAHELHKLMTAKENEYLDPLGLAKRALDQKITAFEIAERNRADQEARTREAEARRAEEERLLSEAAAAEEAGDKELAAAIIEQPIEAPAVLPQPELAKVAGTSARTTWSAEVVDLKALVKYVAGTPDFLHLIQANEVALNAMARALKGEMRIPGVRAVSSVARSYRD